MDTVSTDFLTWLRPTTLAALIVDIQNADEEAGLPGDDAEFIDAAKAALVALVGNNDAMLLIDQAGGEL